MIRICLLGLFIIHIKSVPHDTSRGNPDPYAKKKPLSNLILQPPCCMDLIGTLACKRLQKNNPANFNRRCHYDPDFSILQCCEACGKSKVAHRHALLFPDGDESRFCFDRHGPNFCQAFMLKRDVWSRTSWSCSGEHAQLAFRICRKTCGYCRHDLYAEERKPIPAVSFPHPTSHRKCKSFV